MTSITLLLSSLTVRLKKPIDFKNHWHLNKNWSSPSNFTLHKPFYMIEGFSSQLSEASPALNHVWIFLCSLSTVKHNSSCNHQVKVSPAVASDFLFFSTNNKYPATHNANTTCMQQLFCFRVAKPVTPRYSQEIEKQSSWGWQISEMIFNACSV